MALALVQQTELAVLDYDIALLEAARGCAGEALVQVVLGHAESWHSILLRWLAALLTFEHVLEQVQAIFVHV